MKAIQFTIEASTDKRSTATIPLDAIQRIDYMPGETAAAIGTVSVKAYGMRTNTVIYTGSGARALYDALIDWVVDPAAADLFTVKPEEQKPKSMGYDEAMGDLTKAIGTLASALVTFDKILKGQNGTRA